MIYLRRERTELEEFLPGFDAELQSVSRQQAESPDSDVVERFRKAGGGNLLIPTELGGAGASARQAVRIQRAVGSRCPSLAVGSTMHHYKVAWLAAEVREPAKLAVLGTLAGQHGLVASCGAESHHGLFHPGISVRDVPEGLSVTGIKRPCSLVWSMSLLSMLIATPEQGPYAGDLANVLVPATNPGVSRSTMWASPVLAAAQTHQIRLEDVVIPHAAVIRLGPPGRAAVLLTSSMVWFEMLITAAYLGVASGLVEQVLEQQRGRPDDRCAIAGQLESVMAGLEGVAAGLDHGVADDDALAQVLFVRYAAQRAIAEATDRALELLGGGAFCADAEGVLLLGASRGLGFHPPAEHTVRESLDRYLTHGELILA